MELEGFTFDAAKQRGDLMGNGIIDVTDEPQSQMIIFGVDPARSRQAATQCCERLPDIGRNFNSGEKTRHG
jgi:hypothetical protein